MPLYDSEKCYPLFEQGPCNDGEWFVLNSLTIEINGRLLPYPHCEKATYCDGELQTDYEGKNKLFANLLDGNYVFIWKVHFLFTSYFDKLVMIVKMFGFKTYPITLHTGSIFLNFDI